MDPYVGEIRLFAGNYAPVGWALCNGQIMQVQVNPVLFSIIGNVYGGDGRTTFALPDLRGRAPMHWGGGAGLTPRKYNEKGGEATVTLLYDQMPVHNHLANAQTVSDQMTAEGAIWANAGASGRGGFQFYSDILDTTMNPQAITPMGGSQPHNNMQPFAVMNFIIALEGVYPPKQ